MKKDYSSSYSKPNCFKYTQQGSFSLGIGSLPESRGIIFSEINFTKSSSLQEYSTYLKSPPRFAFPSYFISNVVG